jgi:DNA-binding MarR family transcriptional regulator
MVENGYLAYQRSHHDRRSIHVQLTDKGRRLRNDLSDMHRRHSEMLTSFSLLKTADLELVAENLRSLERFWVGAGDLAQRPARAAA